MGIQELPLGLFAKIIADVVALETPGVAWKLRQVSREYSDYIKTEVFERQPLAAFIQFEASSGNNRPQIIPLLRNKLYTFVFEHRKFIGARDLLKETFGQIADFLMPSMNHTTHRERVFWPLCRALASVRSGDAGAHAICLMLKDGSTTSTPEDMTHEQRNLSTQFACATIMGNAAAMQDCLDKGVKVWDDGGFFEYPLALAVRNHSQQSVNTILSHMPSGVTRATNEYAQVHATLNKVIRDAFRCRDFGLAGIILDWYGNHMPVARVSLQTRWLEAAFRSRDINIVASVLRVMNVQNGLVLPWYIYCQILDTDDATIIKLCIQNKVFDVD
ncbi:hypothetical protein P154DRAFT_574811 [Amniculicola lignicola CBS 123094]|uniref:Uncharacterized protein n=1 Tax=Amniculicola lignicola CBS 123094 TaxID=1392246 RepID=A0A6A5WW16_9PLEO|nr:hypothetical protein P154DRAFT_574811 [Amniculicola lignicola CBS 123094]